MTGLGRYGTNCQPFTPERCGGRMGSSVPDLELGEHPLVTADELCLLKAGKTCGVKSPLPVGQRSTALPTGSVRSSIPGSSGGGCRLAPFSAEGRLDGPAHLRQ